MVGHLRVAKNQDHLPTIAIHILAELGGKRKGKMELTASEFYRLQKIYPLSRYKSRAEPLSVSKGRQKQDMRMHLAKERYGKMRPLWSALIQIRRDGFTLDEASKILEVDIETILTEWDRLRQWSR